MIKIKQFLQSKNEFEAITEIHNLVTHEDKISLKKTLEIWEEINSDLFKMSFLMYKNDGSGKITVWYENGNKDMELYFDDMMNTINEKYWNLDGSVRQGLIE